MKTSKWTLTLILALLPFGGHADNASDFTRLKAITQQYAAHQIDSDRFISQGDQILNRVELSRDPSVQQDQIEIVVKLSALLLKVDEDSGISDDLFYNVYRQAPGAFERVMQSPRLLTPAQADMLKEAVKGAKYRFGGGS